MNRTLEFLLKKNKMKWLCVIKWTVLLLDYKLNYNMVNENPFHGGNLEKRVYEHKAFWVRG